MNRKVLSGGLCFGVVEFWVPKPETQKHRAHCFDNGSTEGKATLECVETWEIYFAGLLTI